MTNLLFTTLSVGNVALRNRIVLPPMCQYSADENGMANEYHFVHYGVRALSGAALCIAEATAVTADGRISGRDLGLWSDDQVPSMTQLARSMASFGSVPGIQLGHAGRKAWPDVKHMVAPSPIPFSAEHKTPSAMTTEEILKTIDAFVAAAQRAVQADFKVLELHAAHGYLIHEFLSPLSNKRRDTYGGSMENRHRFLLEIVGACFKAIPEDVALIVRISGTEYAEEGYSLQEMVSLSKSLEAHGIAAIHVSTGGNVPLRPDVFPGYQLPYARAIREAVGIPVIGVGMLGTPALAEYALQDSACDLVAVGRAYLHDPHWAITAARALGGYKLVVEMVKALMTEYKVSVPVAIHLDHGSSFDACIQAIDAGFTSVMIDGSHYPLNENIVLTKRVVDVAHVLGLTVEAELGRIAGQEDDLVVTDAEKAYAVPEECERLVRETGVDCLAPALGSVHGPYKGKPNLGFGRMEIIGKQTGVPMVLHGGTGIPVEDIRRAISLGTAKINVNTENQLASARKIREVLAAKPDMYDPRKYLGPARDAIREAVIQKMREFGSSGRA